MVKLLLLKHCCFVVNLVWGCYIISGIIWLESLTLAWISFLQIQYSGLYVLVTFLHFTKLFNSIILLYGLLNEKRALVAIFLMTICVCLTIFLVHCVIFATMTPPIEGLETGHYIAMPVYFVIYAYFLWVIYSYYIYTRDPPPHVSSTSIEFAEVVDAR
ncbi:uncharacterized protein [Drosophila pseudoobscura]|uniref:Uncharacterized protein n=1 Tax=Drosophila pseudoobscura pseudoobscura TaxID=46245 RepID=A0A6I8VG37_DROPS|nr:uncharacterized protein LOC26534008 [Drosophila pseudoobscura]